MSKKNPSRAEQAATDDPRASGEHQHGDMGNRGVARPMSLMHHGVGDADDEHRDQSEGGDSHESHGDHHHEMSHDDRLQMLQQHHRQTLWVYWSLVMLGLWTALAPFTFGYRDPANWVDPSGGRGAWWSDQPLTELRATLMTYSDVIAGVLLTLLGWRSLTPNRPKTLWACCFLGVWLTVAPVLFWCPTAAGYLNDTFVGAWVIALTILIPGMPNMIMYMKMGGDTPPGWSYNPSSWPQRWIMIATGLAGWFVSRYVAMYQLGYIDFAWDPVFGFHGGTQPVLNSDMSHAWPISDGALGGISYTFEFLMGFMGSPARWRTMPWMVAFFGILVIPLGLTHILLVISQPVIVHHWCFMCLLAAVIMLPMIPLEVDEVVAMGQHMVEAKRRGDRGGSLWKIFWLGGSAKGCPNDQRTPPLQDLPQRPKAVLLSSIWGMSAPWTLTASAVIGLALMGVPAALDVDIKSHAADICHLGGALLLTVAVVSMGEVIRAGRYLNVVIGLAVAALPWVVDGGTLGSAVITTIGGATAALLALPRGVVKEDYGLWSPYVR